MVTMIVNFNREKLRQQGLTVEQLLAPYAAFCEEYAILRPEINVFEKEGEHGFALIGKIMSELLRNDAYVSLMESWYWDVDGEHEDLLATAHRWKNRK